MIVGPPICVGLVCIGTEPDARRRHTLEPGDICGVARLHGGDLVVVEGHPPALVDPQEVRILFGDASRQDDGGIIYSNSAGSMSFRTNGNSEKMRIAAADSP